MVLAAKGSNAVKLSHVGKGTVSAFKASIFINFIMS